jgi:hypothetical protein
MLQAVLARYLRHGSMVRDGSGHSRSHAESGLAEDKGDRFTVLPFRDKNTKKLDE